MTRKQIKEKTAYSPRVMLPHHVRSYSIIWCRPTRHKSTLTSWDWVESSWSKPLSNVHTRTLLLQSTKRKWVARLPKSEQRMMSFTKKLMHIVRVQWRLSNCCGALATWCTCFIHLFGSLYVVCTMKDLIFFLLSALFNICQVDNSKRVECFVCVNHYWVYENFTLNHLR